MSDIIALKIFQKADTRDAGLRLMKTGEGKSPRLGATLATSM